jgi:RHS repeat-associated protein
MIDKISITNIFENETAIYENSVLVYFNIWGAGLEGKIKKDDKGNTIYSYYYKDHLGSITAVMDGASGTITQAQDYDSWGDICRTYSTTDTTSNKFTGKERDHETGYDYFGARYYDSRIGRWLQIEPLYDKYLQYSPYQYGLLNPMILKDAEGMDVYLSNLDKAGDNKPVINAVKQLNESLSGNFFVSVDPESGKLSYEGDATTAQEKWLVNAIENNNVDVNLKITKENFIGSEPLFIGMYGGSETKENRIKAAQYINLEQALVWNKAGGSSVGLSILHEIMESYVGALLSPGKGYTKLNYLKAHGVTVYNENPKQFNPLIIRMNLYINEKEYILDKVYLGSKGGKQLFLYENPDAEIFRRFKK